MKRAGRLSRLGRAIIGRAIATLIAPVAESAAAPGSPSAVRDRVLSELDATVAILREELGHHRVAYYWRTQQRAEHQAEHARLEHRISEALAAGDRASARHDLARQLQIEAEQAAAVADQDAATAEAIDRLEQTLQDMRQLRREIEHHSQDIWQDIWPQAIRPLTPRSLSDGDSQPGPGEASPTPPRSLVDLAAESAGRLERVRALLATLTPPGDSPRPGGPSPSAPAALEALVLDQRLEERWAQLTRGTQP